jgi:protocatechuate 3,4-dioxygenase beta subunit
MRTSPAWGRVGIFTLVLFAGGVLLFLLLPRQSRVVVHGEASRSGDRDSKDRGVAELVATEAVPSAARSSLEPGSDATRGSSPVGLISGIVFGPSDQPVEGALCRLLSGTAPSGLSHMLADPGDVLPREEEEARVRSDAAGRFELTATEGHWRLRVEAEGLRSFQEDHLEAGAFRWVRLQPAAELRVRVLDEAEVPLADARVELVADEYTPSARAVAHGVTDHDGVATLAPPLGRWVLAVRHSDHRPHFEALELEEGRARVERTVVLSTGVRVFGRVSIGASAAPPRGTRVAIDSILMFQESRMLECEADGSFDSGRVFSSEQVLEVAALAPGFGELRKELDLAGQPADHEVEVHLTVERPERAVRGRVVDSAGAPVGDASVFAKPLLALAAETETFLPEDAARIAAMDVGEGPAESYQAQWRWTTRTNSSGEFRVDGLDFRRPYALLVVSRERANVRAWIDAANSPSELDLGTIVLPAGGGLHGIVRARDGRSVAGLPVSTIWIERVVLRAGTTFKNQRPTALTEGFQESTNLDGEFALRPLPAGEYAVVVAGEEFGPFAVVDGEDRGPEILELGALDETAGLSGRMVDDRGRPLDGCLVQLFHVSEGGGLTLVSATSAGAGGDFLLDASSQGPFLFRAFDIAGEYLAYELRCEDVELWPGGDIALLPQPNVGQPIAGRILDPTSNGLANLRVTLHISPAVTGCTCVSRATTTASDGSFSFGPMVLGTHRLVILDPEGRFPPVERFPVQPGDPLELVLEE